MDAAEDGTRTVDSPFVIDVRDGDFEQAVLERSRSVPVVVDFWAPWCAPCRTLGPILERIAVEHAGAFVLAKVNVDEARRVASGLDVRSIPAVLAFRDGRISREFVGAKPEAEVRRFVNAVLPTEADRLAVDGENFERDGELAQAEANFRAALAGDARHARAALALARLLAGRGANEEALAWLERVVAGSVLAAEGERLAATIRSRAASGGASPDEHAFERLAGEVARDPDDAAAALALAHWLAGAQRYEEALAAYLASLRLDPRLDDESARRGMLDLFAILGHDHDLTRRFRPEMARALYR